MWSRIRHRRSQALALLLLAALLTTSCCLGPLYQRAMEQALARYELEQAGPEARALRLTGTDAEAADLTALLPAGLAERLGEPVESHTVNLGLDNGEQDLVARLYAVEGACGHVALVDGACPVAPDEVMVSDRDVEVNGWRVGQRVRFTQAVDRAEDAASAPRGSVTVAGVYRADPAADWLGAPIVGRAGHVVEGLGLATDDWLTVPEAFIGPAPLEPWFEPDTSVAYPLPVDAGVDTLVEVGGSVREMQTTIRPGSGVRVDSGLRGLASDVDAGREQGRTTVVVLVAQLLVLVAVVLWMVLGAATDDRRPELALARLRGRGRRGARRFLLVELLPIALVGVALGAALAPPAMVLVGRVVFPVPVPVELPRGFVLSSLGAAAGVALVVVAAAVRAVREPLDSLLRGVPVRRAGATGDVATVVFSLTAVLALVTGTLDGPLATLAPSLLAVAGGLVLGRLLGPVARVMSRRLLARGRAVPAAGVVNAVRRPAARRVLVMVLVASALVVFCSAALATARENRESAAEQAAGAPYVLALRTPVLEDVTDAVAEVDPDREHVTPVVTVRPTGDDRGPTVAVDPVVFGRIAYFPRAGRGVFDAAAVLAPDLAPVTLHGRRLTGVVELERVGFGGVSDRTDEARLRVELKRDDGVTQEVDLAAVPPRGGAVPIDVAVPCPGVCVVTGLVVSTPPGLAVRASAVLRDLVVDGAPVVLGTAADWRTGESDGGTVAARDAEDGLAVDVATDGSEPPALRHRWVPGPVPALVTADEGDTFDAPGLDGPVTMAAAGTLPRVPGSPPGSRVVDLAGLQRLPAVGVGDDVVEVWTDSEAAADEVADALDARGVVVDSRTPETRVRADLDASPAAWSLALSVLVGSAAVLVAALVMLVSTATTWRARAGDLAALRVAGVGPRSLRRIEVLAQLPVVLAGALVGGGLGVTAALLAVPGIRQFTEEPEVDTTAFGVPWPVVVTVFAVTAVLLSGLALATARWTVGRARLSRIRGVV